MRDPRHPLSFTLLLLPCVIVARFAAVAVHEILGHGLASLLSGGTFYAVYVSPGQGAAWSHLPGDGGWVPVVLAGIAAELLLGCLLLGVYPRARGFLLRLFLLVLLSVLLVHTLLYMAVGALPVPSSNGDAGDTALAVALLGAPALAWAFLLAGLVWASVVMYILSRHLLILLGDALTRHPEQLYLGLFWLLPLVLALAAIWGLGSAAGSGALIYLGLFGGLAALAYAIAARPASRHAEGRPLSRDPADWRGLPALAVSLLLVLALWIGAFGVTQARAHGLVLAEPPAEEESSWWYGKIVNVEVHIGDGPSLTVTFRFRGLASPQSPLEERLWRSFDGRADFEEYAREARVRASVMFNGTSWEVAASPSIEGTVWSASGELPYARVVPLRLVPGPQGARVFRGANGFYNLSIADPYKVDAGFLDELNLSWDPTVQETGLLSDPLGQRTDEFPPAGPRSFIRLRNHFYAESPAWYRLGIRLA